MTMILRGFYILLTFLMIVGCSDRNLSVSVLRSELKAKTCASGEYRNTTSGLCEPAGPGYYAAVGSDEREPCDAGRYCSSSYNTSGSGDGPCAGGKFCPAGSTDAQGSGDCRAGYYCPTGSGTASGAGACGGGTYSGPGQSVCSDCTFSSTTFLHATAVEYSRTESALTTNSCTVDEITSCQSGYRVNSSNRLSCRTECASGTYWQAGSCQPVPQNYYTTNDDEHLTACPPNSQTASTGATSINACLGKEGYYNCQSGICYSTTTDASPNTYSPPGTNSLMMCTAGFACSSGLQVACGSGTFAGPGAADCSPCSNPITHSTSVVFGASSALTTDSCPVASITSCESGFILDSGNVQCRSRCPIGSYFDGSSCQLTPAGYYTTYNTDTKVACPWGSTSTTGNYVGGTQVQGIGACSNIAGYTCRYFTDATMGSPPKCEPTPEGFYSLAATSSSAGNLGTPIACAAGYDCPAMPCTGTDGATCPAGATSSQGAGLCQPGKYSSGGTGCMACTNKPDHATDFVYAWGSAGSPVVTANSCPLAYINSCDAGWTLSSDQKSCETNNVCWQTTPVSPGTSCGDGTYYVGEQTRSGKKYRLMMTGGNCITTGGVTTCSGAGDSTYIKFYDLTMNAGAAAEITPSETDGAATTSQIGGNPAYVSAHFCSSMVTGTPNYSDWFLPAHDQFQLLKPSNISSSLLNSLGFRTSGGYYWVSTSKQATKAYSIGLTDFNFYQTSMASDSYVRCMREVQVQ